MDKNSINEVSQFTPDQKKLAAMLFLYFLLFLASGVVFQISSGKPPEISGRLDSFTSSIIWAGSIMSFLIAVEKMHIPRKFLFWCVVSAAFGVVAIDEIAELHEKTLEIFGEDDYIKILMWLSGAVGIFLIYKIDKPIKIAMICLIIGYLCQTGWIITDMGDGDFFTLPIPRSILLWQEEIFEVLAMEWFLVGFLFQYRYLLKKG